MSIRKRGESWQVRVRPFADRSFPTKDAAETYELDRKLKLKLGELYQEKPTLFGEEIDGYLERKGSMRPLRPASVEFFEKSARTWKPLRSMPVCNLRRAVIEDHIKRRAGKTPVAARNELQLAKAVLKDAASRGQVIDAGIFDIPAVRTEHAEGQLLEREQLALLQAAMPDRIDRIVPFVASVGLRLTEALSLSDAMVDLAAGELHIPRDLNKSRRPKPIPIGRHEAQLLREQMMARPIGASLLFPNAAGEMYSHSGFRHQWNPALKIAKLEGFKFHWLRHTAISTMARAGMPVETIALRVGHGDGGALILRLYRHLYPSEARAAVSLLDSYLDGQESAIVIASAEGNR